MNPNFTIKKSLTEPRLARGLLLGIGLEFLYNQILVIQPKLRMDNILPAFDIIGLIVADQIPVDPTLVLHDRNLKIIPRIHAINLGSLPFRTKDLPNAQLRPPSHVRKDPFVKKFKLPCIENHVQIILTDFFGDLQNQQIGSFLF